MTINWNIDCVKQLAKLFISDVDGYDLNLVCTYYLVSLSSIWF